MPRRLLPALLVLLAACGSDPAIPPPLPPTPNPPTAEADLNAGGPSRTSTVAEERLRAAPAATTSAGTALTTFVATLTGVPGRPEPVSLHGSGAVDFTTGRSRSNIDLSGALKVPLAERPAPQAGPPDMSWETISADGAVYLRAPMLVDLLGIETPWVRIDPSSDLLEAADGFAPLSQLAGSDSGAPLALLAGLEPESVTDLGAEDVQGTATSHLRATVDLLAAAGAVPGGDLSDAQRQALERFADGLGARQLTVDVFLDRAGRVRRLVYEHALAPEAGGGSQRVELGYGDFGVPVDITVPPEDQVSELDQVFSGG